MSATSFAKVTLGFGLVLFGLAILFENGAVHAAGYDVCASGCKYATIQAAVSAAGNGQQIMIAPGVYHESVSLTKPVTLLGPQYDASGSRPFDPANEAVVIGAVDSGNGFKSAFQVLHADVTINGLTIGDASAPSPNPYDGVEALGGSTNFRLLSSIVRNQATGVAVHASNSITFNNDRFDNDDVGIHAMNVVNAWIGTDAPVSFTGKGQYGAWFETSQNLRFVNVSASGPVAAQATFFNNSDNVTVAGATQAHVAAASIPFAAAATAPAPAQAAPATTAPTAATTSPSRPATAPVTPAATAPAAPSATVLQKQAASVTPAAVAVPAVLPSTGPASAAVPLGVAGLIAIAGTAAAGGFRLLKQR